MKLENVVLTLAALAVAVPAFAADEPPSVVTTGTWTASKPGARGAASPGAAGVPIMTGAWIPSKPAARAVAADAVRAPVTTGPWVPTKPWARPSSR